MGQPIVKVGVVDIGTNSVRLLVTGDQGEEGRWVEITGLGRGLDNSGLIGEGPMAETLVVLERYGRVMDEHQVDIRAAMATSATRDASNREVFLERAERVLGVRPQVITGEREGRLAHAGATSGLDASYRHLVCDIGGGSTELVTPYTVVSVDIGSVRLTERALPDRPSQPAAVQHAIDLVNGLFAPLPAVEFDRLVGVAGTWTSLAAIDLDLAAYDPARVHLHAIERGRLDGLVRRLAGMSVEETAAIPSLDPGRAPVILAGAVIALCVMERLGAATCLASERDTLDGLAAELLA